MSYFIWQWGCSLKRDTELEKRLIKKYGMYASMKDLNGFMSVDKIRRALEEERIHGIRVGKRSIRIYVPSLVNLVEEEDV